MSYPVHELSGMGELSAAELSARYLCLALAYNALGRVGLSPEAQAVLTRMRTFHPSIGFADAVALEQRAQAIVAGICEQVTLDNLDHGV